jgi:predicted metal-binding membrane protein
MSGLACGTCAAGDQEAPRLPVTGRRSQWPFLAASASLFLISAALTVHWCGSMATTCGCGADVAGCPLAPSMWRPSPGRDWPVVALEFLGMWNVMMAAMMLPSLVPRLWSYRRAVAGNIRRAESVSGARLDRLTAAAALGYASAWIVAGMVVFPVGATLAVLVREFPPFADAAPIAVAVIFMLAGALQFTAWKARQLACCRGAHSDQTSPIDHRSAWRHGLHLGLHCVRCCAAFTVMLLAIGMMDLHAMALVTLAITLERLLPDPERVARVIGAVTAITGLVMLVRAST